MPRMLRHFVNIDHKPQDWRRSTKATSKRGDGGVGGVELPRWQTLQSFVSAHSAGHNPGGRLSLGMARVG
jgi:hypothetical protein